MHLKRYRRSSVRDALASVRRELGPDALVLSVTTVRAEGWRGWVGARAVEVMAAAERGAARASGQAAPAADDQPRSPLESGLVARLCASGIDRDLACAVTASLPDCTRRTAAPEAICRALAARVGTLAAGHEPPAPVTVFVGPPGAGKTTTIAKIAAQARARARARFALVSADGFRVGAVEQLRLYAGIIGAPFSASRTPGELKQALGAARGPVLVDTAGRSPEDEIANELFDVVSADPRARTHLVVPATTNPRDLSRLLERYRRARPSRLVLTKIDEAGTTIAPLVGVLRHWQLPVSFLGVGQGVPEDLDVATPSALAAAMLGHDLRGAA
jgi:flagellar biosynthesis protein FlhF